MRRLPFVLLGMGLLMPLLASAHPKMLFVGDSITAGGGAATPATEGFVALFGARFPELRVVNLGCPGSTTRDWTTDRLSIGCMFANAWELLAAPQLPAQLTHVMLGTNDAYGFYEWFPDGSHGNWVTPEEYEERLRSVIARAPGRVIVSTAPPLVYRITGPVVERLQSYRDVVLAVVDDYPRVELGVDFYALLDRYTDVVGCHPNNRGHAIMADALERRMLSLVPLGAFARYKNGGRFSAGPQRGHHGALHRHDTEVPNPNGAIDAVGWPCEGVTPEG